MTWIPCFKCKEMTVCNCKNLHIQSVDYSVDYDANNANLIAILTQLIMEKDKIISDLRQEIKKLEMVNAINFDVNIHTHKKFDQFGRELPLPDHDIDCEHGKFGCGLCTCIIKTEGN